MSLERIYFENFFELASVVRGRRAELRLSQAELAARAQVDRRLIGVLESGEGTRNVVGTHSVLESLGVEPHSLPGLPPAEVTIDAAGYRTQFER